MFGPSVALITTGAPPSSASPLRTVVARLPPWSWSKPSAAQEVFESTVRINFRPPQVLPESPLGQRSIATQETRRTTGSVRDTDIVADFFCGSWPSGLAFVAFLAGQGV